ncbi:hypothetical protein EMIHUDRAFT_252336 [Emiliania huxleyi CCMP1516]|uniref:Uncharacterized protein n=2 Tax=Emiliania huxleyi TaxID=2903 RepID=A0A0D3KL30_EMIH1|nr:hypothetical protein EMIHUDRAFT_252336 [Emiliania huxleyi CCMP1516]EOD36465.1 hypothetical protein EMIHUDRAFT_252336 [Emiliania huxleyi CCMP1516]|eukprot:XP_005788894.1 hypothetical protein EMIHUDRAFT_252336 [Emiliania huxleyi CCMP1516]
MAARDEQAPLLGRVREACCAALRGAGLEPRDVYSVEMLGGLSRMPAVGEAVSTSFQMPTRRSLNAEEARDLGRDGEMFRF